MGQKASKILKNLENYEYNEKNHIRTQEQEKRFWALVFLCIVTLLAVFLYLLITVRLNQSITGGIIIDFLPICLMLAAAILFASWVIVKQAESNKRDMQYRLSKKQVRRLNICLYIDMAFILFVIYLFWQVMSRYGG